MATSARIRSTRLLLVGLLLASLVTITIDARSGDRGPLSLAGRALGAVIGPLQEGVATVFRPVGNWLVNVFRAGSLADENASLRRQLDLARRQVQEEQTLRRENEEFKQLLGLSDSLSLQTVGATVVGESQGNFEWGVIIDRGSLDGVTVDMPVIAAEGLVGRVVEVYPAQAKVMLIIDPDSAVAARLANSGERGLIEGQRDEPLRFTLVDEDVEIQPGELVETSGYQLQEGLEGLFPPGIPIGVVDRVEPDESDLAPRVLVRPNVDFSTLDFVALVTGTEVVPPDVTEEGGAAG